jgi:integrase/recombinase XerD
MNLQKLFDQFIQSGLYLRNWSQKTPPIYRRAFASFQQSQRHSLASGETERLDRALGPLTKAQLEAWVVASRKVGMSPACCNIYIRAMNAFCSWLHEQGHLTTAIKLGQLKAHTKPVQVFSEAEIKLLLAAKPKRLLYLRTWTLIVTLLDTGCRIDELLTLERKNLDFDNLLLTVRGKGDKTRRIPFSADCRKHLWTYCQKWEARNGAQGLVFSTERGGELAYRNAYRDIKACFKVAGVEGEHVHPHNLRHTFACNYVKRGGSVVALSRILGHSSLTTTQVYLRGLQIEDFQESRHLTPLARL